jgi:hypothetical protein
VSNREPCSLLDVSPQNGDVADSSPEMRRRLGHRELKGLRTVLLRSIRDQRLPEPYRASIRQQLREVETLLGKNGTADA